MTNITSKERFDDVASKNPDGTVDYAYHGFNYVIAVDEHLFHVRTYDDEPGVATVISPTDARTCPEARALVDFITSTLGCTSLKFYCGWIGTYCSVEIRTLEFTVRSHSS
ncbi:conserved hypothetical protein [Rippkaea orientalis PCC 8801]|uniref:Uncharacterized protein n=1 Tax=Rippkaea orientalis (strain PCC 8801 / RF-1) TaxID=41431 RepID=B7K462_RIPO1|nr:conserved hypothetical protein [Rippkaea orientalis PCC 8801]